MQADRSNILVTTLEIIDHIIGNGSDRLNCSTLDHEARLRAQRLPLGADNLTTGLCLRLEPIVVDYPQAELLSAPGWLHMLNTDMDPFLDNAVSNLDKVDIRGKVNNLVLNFSVHNMFLVHYG